MDEKLGYPPAAIRWNIGGDSDGHTGRAFRSIIAARGFRVLIERSFDGKREPMRPDSIEGTSLLWSEHDSRRSHLMGLRGDTAVALIRQGSDDAVTMIVASNDRELSRSIIAEVERRLPYQEIADEIVVPMTFWHRGSDGPEITTRQIEAASWTEVASNYVSRTRMEMSPLMEGFNPAKATGRLLLWHGEPGTGKTFAIRALAWAWKEWCRFEYVIDPEQLFGSGSYLAEVALNRFETHFMFEDSPLKEKWRLLIVEDSGEMMAVDAKNEIGQGLSRLLNLSDGILGQGTKILILVTTNEAIGKLNPAIRRHGRCLSEIEFRRFNADEAAAWLRAGGSNVGSGGPRTLSELYAIRSGAKPPHNSRAIGFRSSKLQPDDIALEG
jgi:Domain of unknown function (DUF5925)/ATPase family associated with various cellular activities (AAA)